MADTNDFRPIIEEWNITYQHATGPIVGSFLRTLREEARLIGRFCPECSRVLVPPRSFCDRDFSETTTWVDIGNQGTIETFTIVYQKFVGLPDPPYCIAYVLLEGADTAILNYVRGIDLSVDEAVNDVAMGTPVIAKFLPGNRREGRITDFWFEKIAAV